MIRTLLNKSLILAASLLVVCATFTSAEISLSADLLADRGNERFGRGDVSGALDDFAGAIKIDPHCVKAYVGRATLVLRLGRFDDAIADYSRATEINPKSREAFLGRAMSRQGKGDYAGAVTDFTNAINLAKKDPAIYESRADARFLAGDLDGAAADCRQALALDPRDSGALNISALISERKHNFTEASKACDAAIAINANDSLAYAIRGMQRANMYDYEAAIVDGDRGDGRCRWRRSRYGRKMHMHTRAGAGLIAEEAILTRRLPIRIRR